MYSNGSSICLPNKNQIDVLVWQIGALLFPILGIPGHVIIIIIMIKFPKRRSQPTSLYFILIAIVETIYLLFFFWDWLDAVNLTRDPRQILNCGLFYPFVRGTGYISLILVVQLNLDRINMINKPQQIYLHSNQKRISVKILLACSTFILFIFNYGFSLHYDSKGFIVYGQSCSVYKHARLWYYSIWPYIHLIARIIPCLILIICTIYIFYNRYYRKYNRASAAHRQQQKSSLVLLMLSIYTFTAIIPISVLQIFNRKMWEYEFECLSCHCIENNVQALNWKLLNAICIMWETSIYMNKFYIKFLFSSEFRSDVKKVIFCQRTTEINRV